MGHLKFDYAATTRPKKVCLSPRARNGALCRIRSVPPFTTTTSLCCHTANDEGREPDLRAALHPALRPPRGTSDDDVVSHTEWLPSPLRDVKLLSFALLELEQLRAVKRAYATLDPTVRCVQVRGVG